jgi:hypothetical protein
LFHVNGEGWVPAEALRVGAGLDGIGDNRPAVEHVAVEYLSDDIATFNLRVDAVSTYFVHTGRGPVLVHNGGDDDFDRTLFWSMGKKLNLRPDDADGLSMWRTDSRADVDRLMQHRVDVDRRKASDPHSYVTGDQLASAGLEAPQTPGRGTLAEAGFPHHSLRPSDAPAYAEQNELDQAQMSDLRERLNQVEPNPLRPRELRC